MSATNAWASAPSSACSPGFRSTLDCRGERDLVLVDDDGAASAIENEPGAHDGRGDDRHAERHGFEQDEALCLRARREYEGVRAPVAVEEGPDRSR